MFVQNEDEVVDLLDADEDDVVCLEDLAEVEPLVKLVRLVC